MTETQTVSPAPTSRAPGVQRTAWGRLVESQTAIDFVGHRRLGPIISGILIVLTVISSPHVELTRLTLTSSTGTPAASANASRIAVPTASGWSPT